MTIAIKESKVIKTLDKEKQNQRKVPAEETTEPIGTHTTQLTFPDK